jgi:hypothetical protein
VFDWLVKLKLSVTSPIATGLLCISTLLHRQLLSPLNIRAAEFLSLHQGFRHYDPQEEPSQQPSTSR